MVLEYYYDLRSQPCRAVHLLLKLNNVDFKAHKIDLRAGKSCNLSILFCLSMPSSGILERFYKLLPVKPYPVDKMSSTKYNVCYNFQSALMSFKNGKRIVRVSNSLDSDETQGYSGSHQVGSCLQMGQWSRSAG